MILAATTQHRIALFIFLIAGIGWVLWILANIRRARPEVGAEIELAPNRKPYYSDEELEGVRLERAQLFGLACLVVIGVGLPLYWLAEPGRQAHAIENFDETFASRGAALFAPTAEGGFNCAGCHGGLDGGTAPYTVTDPSTGKPVRQVDWPAPALRYVALRMTDDQIRLVLTYGRPYSPMPAWGLLGGGPMNDQQIDNLIAYLKSVAGVPPYSGQEANVKKAQEAATSAAEAELTRLNTLPQQLEDAQAKLAAATTLSERTTLENQVHSLQEEIDVNQEKTMGAALFNTNCARCHTYGWSDGDPHAPGSGAMGPSLYNVLNQFPTEAQQIAWVTDGAKLGAKYGTFGTATGKMPYFSQVLSKDQIQQIVDYERSLAETATSGK
jgi:mono/diheme cytochrome c family protein